MGYSLTLTMTDGKSEDTGAVELIASHVPEAEPSGSAGLERTFRMPFACADRLSDMFDVLEQKKAELHVQAFGLSVTNLEEVFMKSGRSAAEHVETETPSQEPKHTHEEGEEEALLVRRPSRTQRRPLRLLADHCSALALKRINVARRDKAELCFMLLIPLLGVAFGLTMLKLVSAYVSQESYTLSAGMRHAPLRAN